MPKCKNYLVKIDKFYKFQTFDHICFGYVQGLRKALPSISVNKAIEIFLNTFEIEEDEYCFDAARTTYYRILSSIVEMSSDSVRQGIKPNPEQII